jgi:hypothetical protein
LFVSRSCKVYFVLNICDIGLVRTSECCLWALYIVWVKMTCCEDICWSLQRRNFSLCLKSQPLKHTCFSSRQWTIPKENIPSNCDSLLFIHYLHNMHEMNACGTGHVYLSICAHDCTSELLDAFQWNLMWMICIGGYSKFVLLNFPTLSNMKMANEQTCEVGMTLAPPNVGTYNNV